MRQSARQFLSKSTILTIAVAISPTAAMLDESLMCCFWHARIRASSQWNAGLGMSLRSRAVPLADGMRAVVESPRRRIR